MDMEHEQIIEIKLEKISNHLEDLILNIFIEVLNRLKKQNKATLKADELMPF